MRTTLEIDDRVLIAARSKAAAEGVSLGRAVSDLALRALEGPATGVERAGFPMLPSVPGHVITDEMVAAHRDDE